MGWDKREKEKKKVCFTTQWSSSTQTIKNKPHS
jgi:hypothetical protein